MHKNVNKWLGEGQIKGDFSLRTTQNNYKVTNFLLKIDTSYKVAEKSNNLATYKEETVYVPVVAWNDLAQSIVEKYKTNDIYNDFLKLFLVFWPERARLVALALADPHEGSLWLAAKHKAVHAACFDGLGATATAVLELEPGGQCVDRPLPAGVGRQL